mmetsp:Transcript_5223/g.21506  ORF Transcript_5223/g.21506 Transcript_5223/m.21506 type:complete len:201 (+) Transcript_5223:1755-2357(+)
MPPYHWAFFVCATCSGTPCWGTSMKDTALRASILSTQEAPHGTPYTQPFAPRQPPCHLNSSRGRRGASRRASAAAVVTPLLASRAASVRISRIASACMGMPSTEPSGRATPRSHLYRLSARRLSSGPWTVVTVSSNGSMATAWRAWPGMPTSTPSGVVAPPSHLCWPRNDGPTASTIAPHVLVSDVEADAASRASSVGTT